MTTNLLKALIQRLQDVEGDNLEVSLCCLLDQDSTLDAQLLNQVYLSNQLPGAGSLRDVADIRAIHLGYEGIDDLLAYGRRESVIFEG
jgi:hypothetical protein